MSAFSNTADTPQTKATPKIKKDLVFLSDKYIFLCF